MDDLKNRIWDYLYRRGEPQQVAIIADQMNETPDAIQQAADDPWFDVQDGLVAIAVHETGHAESRGENVRSAEEASSQILRSWFSSGDPTSER